MKGYAERVMFSGEAIDMYHRATDLVKELPDIADPCSLRCHELAHAVGTILCLDVQDGKARAVEHSWLWVPNKEDTRVILDVYTPGRMPMVQLIDPFALLPEIGSYVPGEPRDDINQTVVNLLIEWWGR